MPAILFRNGKRRANGGEEFAIGREQGHVRAQTGADFLESGLLARFPA